MPRSKTLNKSMIDERKDTIVHSALNVFACVGYESANMEYIAKDAKCSRALVYHYYPTKELLFHEVMSTIVCEKLFGLTGSIDYSQKAKHALRELIEKTFAKLVSKDDPDFIKAFFLVLNLHLQGEKLPKPKANSCDRPIERKRMFDIISILIEKGQKEGDFLPGEPKKYAVAILTMYEGLALNRICLKDRFCCPTVDMVMNILLKEKEEK